MSNDQAIAEHYTHGDLLGAIQSSITKLGKTVETVTVEDLAAVDEFHIGGRVATDNLLGQVKFSKDDHILDIGCGLGGAARFVAHKYNNRVTGIDLTQEYIDVGKALSSWVGLEERVTLHQGSALSMQFEDNTFDGAFMLHVGMNIEDKAGLFAEMYRVLRPGAWLGVYDIMRKNGGVMTYPMPWATDATTSSLSTPEQYKEVISNAGFEISSENNRRAFALDFFKNLKAINEANGGPPPLGLHTLMQESTPIKLKNMLDNIATDNIAPVEIIAQKQ